MRGILEINVADFTAGLRGINFTLWPGTSLSLSSWVYSCLLHRKNRVWDHNCMPTHANEAAFYIQVCTKKCDNHLVLDASRNSELVVLLRSRLWKDPLHILPTKQYRYSAQILRWKTLQISKIWKKRDIYFFYICTPHFLLMTLPFNPVSWSFYVIYLFYLRCSTLITSVFVKRTTQRKWTGLDYTKNQYLILWVMILKMTRAK